MLPALVSATGIVCGKQEGFEADDFLAAAVAGERARGGTTLVATSDRDAYQLAAPDVTILQPVRGVSELARIGPAEVRERYGVDPEQVCDFIALRGDPSDKIPGARGIGEKTAATLLQTYPDLESMIAAGRFAAEAEKLRTYRHIATLDPTAPLPDVPDLEPDWAAGARAAEELGVERLASRLREAAEGRPIEPVSHPAMAHLHPTGHHHHPESEHRLRCLIDALRPEIEGGRASVEAIERVHDPDYVARIAGALGGVLARRRHDRPADDLGGGPARCGLLDPSRRDGWVRARAPAGSPCPPRPPRWGSASSGTSSSRRGTPRRSSGSSGSRSSTGTCITGTAPRLSSAATTRSCSSRSTSGRSIPAPAARERTTQTIVNIPLAAGSGDAAYAEAFRTIVEPAVRSFEPGLLIVSAGFDAHVDDPLAHMAVTADGFRDMAARCTQLAPQVAAALEGGYNLETLPGLVEAALDGFNS